MPRFYTLPPMEIPWPYVIINANRPEEGLRYLASHSSIVEAVIIDSGVEIFRDHGAKDYPHGARWWIEKRLVPLWKQVKRAIVPDAEVVVTVPDYPDDYNPRSLWESEWRTNIERTLDNIELATTEYSDVDWLIPIQGWWEQPESIVIGLVEAEAIGALDYAESLCRRTRLVPCIAIANLCVSKNCGTIYKTLIHATDWLVNSPLALRPRPRRAYSVRVHVFGPAVSCVRKIAHRIDSWDSTAWTKPRAPNGSSAWNGSERVYLFLTWIHKYSDIIELPAHPKTMRKRLAIAAGGSRA